MSTYHDSARRYLDTPSKPEIVQLLEHMSHCPQFRGNRDRLQLVEFFMYATADGRFIKWNNTKALYELHIQEGGDDKTFSEGKYKKRYSSARLALNEYNVKEGASQTIHFHLELGEPGGKQDPPQFWRLQGVTLPEPVHSTKGPVQLSDFVGEWHYYHNTRDEAGEFWSYAQLKFPPCKDPAQKLVAEACCLPETPWKTAQPGQEWTAEKIKEYKNGYLYKFEAELIDGHLVIQTTKVNGRSDMSVKVFRDPLPHLSTPKTALMLITHTWLHSPAACVSIMKKRTRLSCDDPVANAILEHAEDGEPIRNPAAIKALSSEWARWCPPGIACLIPGIAGAAGSTDDIICHYIGDDLQASQYTSSEHERLRRIRDTHVISEDGAEQFHDPATYSVLTRGLTTFFLRPGTQLISVVGHRIDTRYIEHILEAATEAAKTLGQSIDEIEKNKITCYRLRSTTTRVTNFLILDRRDKNGTSEAVFGWRQHADGTPGKVFRSDDASLVREFDGAFKNLCQREMSEQVSLRSLLNQGPAQTLITVPGDQLYQQWNEEIMLEMLRRSAKKEGIIRIFVSFFVNETIETISQLLFEANSTRTIELMLLDPDAPILELRYPSDDRSFRDDEITASIAKSHIEEQLARLSRLLRRLQKKAKDNEKVGTLRVYTYQCPPTLISYQSDAEAMLGMLLIHTSGNNGPMILVGEGQPLWGMVKGNWNTVLALDSTRLAVGEPVDRKESLWR